MATEKIFIGIDSDKIELTGADKEAFLEQRAKDQAEAALLEAEYEAKQDSREKVIKKLAEVAGLTKDEIEGLIK